MATPKPVARRLREMLGAEAADTMVEWLDGLEAERDERRREWRAEVAGLRQEMLALRADTAELRAEMRAGFAAVDARFTGFDARFAAFDAKLAQRNADLMKWMVGFWLASFIGILGAILALGRIPR